MEHSVVLHTDHVHKVFNYKRIRHVKVSPYTLNFKQHDQIHKRLIYWSC